MSTRIQVKWRRAKVLELLSQGCTQLEISTVLKVDEPTISRDVQSLRQKAQKDLQKHIHETIPEEYQKCMAGMKSNLKQTLMIAAVSADPRIQLQARAIANDCYKFILDMSTNAGIVSDALKYVASQKEQLAALVKNGDIEEGEKEIQITTTMANNATGGVF